MGKLTRRMIDAIRQDDPNVLDELWVVSDLLRKGWQPNYQSGFADIDAETVSSEEAGELREVLLDAMHRQAHPDKQRSFLFTLAHGGEQSVKERLVRELHVALEMHRAASGLLWTALIELDHIGEGVFAESPKMSHGIDQVADNIEAAVATWTGSGRPVRAGASTSGWTPSPTRWRPRPMRACGTIRRRESPPPCHPAISSCSGTTGTTATTPATSVSSPLGTS
jgi:hypothetical protein